MHHVYMQDFYRCQKGYKAKAASICEEAAKKLVKDMHYEARVQAIIDYYCQYRGMKVKKRRGKNNEPDPETILAGTYRTLILTFYEINYA